MKQIKTLGRFKCKGSHRFENRDRYILKGDVYDDIKPLLQNLPPGYKPIEIMSNLHGIPKKESYQIGNTAVKICESNLLSLSNETLIIIHHTKPKKREKTLKKLIDAFK